MINEEAISLLSSPLKEYFFENRYFISENSIKPDFWKKDTINYPGEGHGHFIDLDFYDEYPFINIPRNLNELIEKHGINNINEWGTAPWRISDFFNRLVISFSNEKWDDVKIIASCLGHYVSDIHVPLHTTKNYNGQLTNNTGIHKRWEINLFEYFLLDNIDIEVNELYFFESPIDQSFLIALDSFLFIDQILESETKAKLNLDDDEILYLKNGSNAIYNDKYYNRLYDDNKLLLVSQIEKSIISVASFWESAWILSGEPTLPKN
tara:strand:+ start:216 stop:1010 length:795 start_codon:yes stop_codon:yes gene_type:complete